MNKIDVSECKYYANGKCERYEQYVEADYYDYTVECICEHENCLGSYDVCDYLELQQLKAENEELKKLKDEILNKKPSEREYCKNCTLPAYRKVLDEIEEIINNFAGEDIITLPDLSKEKNYKLIAEQYAEPIKQILLKIREVKEE